jgi:predicted ATPase/class 3 adenylate cyclase
VTCSACGSENRPGRKFCGTCGEPLALTCPACGAANEAEDRFCGECGSALIDVGADRAVDSETGTVSRLHGSDSERRLVSVLFIDLVGFTPLSESRDAEEVRDLLSRYFDHARQIVERYGGSIEKFIGDAVMAVWGSPIAREDDAERAVRAGLDLVGAVRVLGVDSGVEGLSARGGVATGEAAVNRAAEHEGMVIGDLVNTAARVQSVAEPDQVFVTKGTKHATDAALAYEDAGHHELKGKAEPLHLYQALRVVAGRGGALRAVGLEAPFVGRDRELRLLKDLFHATSEGGVSHLLAVTGIGGIGKTRLAWEFEKYLDGLAGDVYWHRGRCIAYGEGVAYWALAEMVRSRMGIAEEEPPDSTLTKLRAWLAEWCTDTEERRWLETQLGQLLGLGDRDGVAREELFSGWRRFFELLTDRGPVVLVFEDLQWADGGLLDFIDELLVRAGERPLYVVALARPEIGDRRPGWGSGRTGWTGITLGPLRDEDIDRLLRGAVPGLPETLVQRIRERAEGIPLYAVETLRMLLDRGVLARTEDGAELAPGAETTDLAVPETLQALIGGRLDGLPEDERSLLQHASVLGKTFPPQTLAAVTGLEEDRLRQMLDDLVRKELLTEIVDTTSPDRGQFGFLQSIVQRVIYDTLSRRDRKSRHLAVARHLETSWAGDQDDVAEVVAAHYVEAYQSAPTDPDATEIRGAARIALERAGRRAYSLAATTESAAYFDRAAELADDELDRTRLSEQAAMAIFTRGDLEATIGRLDIVIEAYERLGRPLDAARGRARAGEAYWSLDRLEEGLTKMEDAYAELAEETGPDVAALAGQLGRFRYFGATNAQGVHDALEPIERALVLAEAGPYPGVLSDALNTKGLILGSLLRPAEGTALLKAALDIALAHDETVAAVRAYTNLSNDAWEFDSPEEGFVYQEAGRALAERAGLMGNWWFLLAHLTSYLTWTGQWDEVARWWTFTVEHRDDPAAESGYDVLASAWIQVHGLGRGLMDEVSDLVDRVRRLEGSDDVQARAFAEAQLAMIANDRGGHEEAFERADRVLSNPDVLNTRHWLYKLAAEEALRATVAIGDVERGDRVLATLEAIPDGIATPLIGTIETSFRAMLDAQRPGADVESIDRGFREGAASYRDLGAIFRAARVQLAHAEWLASIDRANAAGAVAEEASRVFRDLKAAPWLARAEVIAPSSSRVDAP